MRVPCVERMLPDLREATVTLKGFESSGVAFALELLAQLAEKSPAVLAAAKAGFFLSTRWTALDLGFLMRRG